MAVKFHIDLGNIYAEIQQDMVKGMNEALENTKKHVDRLTPEDTGNLLRGNKIDPAKRDGNSIIGRVYNDIEYAIYVEYGVENRKYNYHKPKGIPFYEGVGNLTFTRAADETKQEALQIIKRALG